MREISEIMKKGRDRELWRLIVRKASIYAPSVVRIWVDDDDDLRA